MRRVTVFSAVMALAARAAVGAPQPLNPAFNGLTLSGLPSASCLGTSSSGAIQSGACGVSGPGTTTAGYLPVWSNGTGSALALGLPVGATGASTVVETNASGQIANSLISDLPNSALANSSVTIAGVPVGLGGSATLAASNLSNGVSGSGAVVLGTSPTLTAPNLGTPSAVVLTNATGLPPGGIAAIGAGTVVGNLSGSSGVPGAVPVTQLGAASSLVETNTNGSVLANGIISRGTTTINAGSGSYDQIVLMPTAVGSPPTITGAGSDGLELVTQNGAPLYTTSRINENATYTYSSSDTAPTAANTLTFISQNLKGTANMASQQMLGNLWLLNDTAAEEDPATQPGGVGFQIVDDLESPYAGGRIGLNFTLQQLAPPADLGDHFYTGIASQAITGFNNGGSDTSKNGAKGRIVGWSAQATAQSGATDLFSVTTQENNCTIDTGASALIRSCLNLAGIYGNVQGSAVDTGLWIYAGAPVAFRDGIEFGAMQAWPVSSYGALIQAQANDSSENTSTTYGIDYRDAAIPSFSPSQTTDPGAFRTNGWDVDGVGTVRQGSFYTSFSSSSGLSIDGKGSIGNGAVTPTVDATAAPHGWNIQDLANDPYGGVITIVAAQAQAATVVSGGSGGTSGACTVTGTTGQGTLAQFAGTVTSGALTGPLTISVAGNYTGPISNIEREPVIGCGLTGATISIDLKPTAIAWYSDANGNKRLPSYEGTTPPANPIALTAYPESTGTGLTADYSWITNATTLALNPSGAPTTVGGSFARDGALSVAVRVISGSTTTTDTDVASDYLIVWDSSDAAAKSESISACSSSNAGRTVIIKDEYGNANTYNITITPASGTIDGAASDVLNAAHASVRLTCDGISNWMVTQ